MAGARSSGRTPGYAANHGTRRRTAKLHQETGGRRRRVASDRRFHGLALSRNFYITRKVESDGACIRLGG
jgi:hypothetical protein